MLINDACSIYEDRPRACRTYDCRVVSAAGIGVEEDKVAIARQIRRWRFSLPTEDDQVQHDAVRAAARYVGDHQDRVSPGQAPRSSTQLAVLAIEMHDAFLRSYGPTDGQAVVDPDPQG